MTKPSAIYRLVVMLVLMMVMFPWRTEAQGDPQTPSLTWEDAPVTTPMRHMADAYVRWGWETSANALGPFNFSPYEVGDLSSFTLDGPRDVVRMQLYHISDHAYFWFELGTAIAPDELRRAGENFDQNIWQLMSYIYDAQIQPGVDNDSRIHLVNLTGRYPYYAGFFRADDQCSRQVCPKSNERDALYMILDNVPFNSDVYTATVAHELQHLMQFQNDGNEYRWLDEGISQLLEHLNGYTNDRINNDNVLNYLANPNHLLNGWSSNYINQGSFYGAGYLFTLYLYERFGLDFIQAVVQNPLDGLAAVNNVLKTTGKDITLDELVADWHLANYLDDGFIADGRYYYATYDLPGAIYQIPFALQNGRGNFRHSLNQYGADYLTLDEGGHFQLHFSGDTTSPLVGVQPVSGQALWWSDNAIGSVTSLTRIIDLREVSHATLKYHVWWQTGDFPGFLHVLASVDEGHTWESLEGRRMVRRSPYNEAPGAHYAGNSGGRWLDDFIDLTGYTGQTVLLRFEYITNNAIAGPGFALDNIRIDEIGWLDDVETQDRDWIVDGFIRTGQMVAQNWIVQVVTNDSPPAITRFKLEAESQTLEFDLPETGGTLLIGAFAPISTTAATYTLQLNRLN